MTLLWVSQWFGIANVSRKLKPRVIKSFTERFLKKCCKNAVKMPFSNVAPIKRPAFEVYQISTNSLHRACQKFENSVRVLERETNLKRLVGSAQWTHKLPKVGQNGPQIAKIDIPPHGWSIWPPGQRSMTVAATYTMRFQLPHMINIQKKVNLFWSAFWEKSIFVLIKFIFNI